MNISIIYKEKYKFVYYVLLVVAKFVCDVKNIGIL